MSHLLDYYCKNGNISAIYLSLPLKKNNLKKSKPIELTLDTLSNAGTISHVEFRFINHEFAIVSSFKRMESVLLRVGQPYRAKENRIIRVLKGKARLSINLIEYTIKENMLSVIPPDSVIEILEISEDYDFQAIAIDNNFLPPLEGGTLTDSYSKQGIILPLEGADWQQTGTYFSLLWDTAQQIPFRRETVKHLVTALLHTIRYIQKQNQDTPTLQMTRQEELFRHFIALVNEYCRCERNINFYAGKLCLTPHYLSTVIRATSGQTVMQWINQAIILEAKVQLKHSNQLVFQISDELGFPNPSFFSKFFKRMTGLTPAEYQKQV